MDALHKAVPMNSYARRLARFWQAALRFWSGRWAWVAWNLTILLLVIVLAQLLVQYLLNQWNRHFFDALERRDATALWMQAGLFIAFMTSSTVLAAASVWARMTMQRKWRKALFRETARYWLDAQRFRRIDYAAGDSENPEYRISEDIRVATEGPVDLAAGFLTSALSAVVFLGVLWSVGDGVSFEAFHVTWTIPAYLVIGVLVYSAFFSGLMMVVGRNLTPVIENKIQSEAELRAAADSLRRDENGGEAAQRRLFWATAHDVLISWRWLCWVLMGTTLVSQSNVLLAPVVAWCLCLPKFLTGAMTLGGLTQAAAAFVIVQGAFNWLVDNFQRLADWRAAARRVAVLLAAIDHANGGLAPPAAPIAKKVMGVE